MFNVSDLTISDFHTFLDALGNGQIDKLPVKLTEEVSLGTEPNTTQILYNQEKELVIFVSKESEQYTAVFHTKTQKLAISWPKNTKHIKVFTDLTYGDPMLRI